MTTWVFLRTEPRLWTVGFYDPQGNWHPESDHESPESAADEVHYLNGGTDDAVIRETPPEEVERRMERVRPHI